MSSWYFFTKLIILWSYNSTYERGCCLCVKIQRPGVPVRHVLSLFLQVRYPWLYCKYAHTGYNHFSVHSFTFTCTVKPCYFGIQGTKKNFNIWRIPYIKVEVVGTFYSPTHMIVISMVFKISVNMISKFNCISCN